MERRRLQLARLHVQPNPSLVVLDEPETAIDHEGRQELRRNLHDLARSCRVLLIAHDRDVIPDTFDVIRLAPQKDAP